MFKTSRKKRLPQETSLRLGKTKSDKIFKNSRLWLLKKAYFYGANLTV
jgi:hypothetical protein